MNINSNGLINLFQDIRNQCVKYKTKLILSSDSHVSYIGNSKMMVNGYFSSEPLELATAIGKPIEQWIGVLAHESCHMDQWIKKTKSWENCIVKELDLECYEVMDNWIDGAKYEKTIILKAIKKCIDVELECEKMTVKKLKKYKINIYNIDEYIQKANSYLFFYGVILKTKKWYKPGKEPYNVKEIWSKMPKKFLTSNEYLNVKDSIYKIINKKF